MEPNRPAGALNARPRSYTYATRVEWVGARAGRLESSGKPSFRVASPPEFKGEPGAWSPEDLFVASVNSCTMTTFLSVVERKGIKIESYASEAEGLLELQEGGFRFTRVTLRPRIQIASAEQRGLAEQAMHEAHEKCLIANSVRAEVRVEPEITTP